MILTTIWLCCDLCGTESLRVDGGIYTPTDLRHQMHQEGWRRRKLGSGLQRDVCPQCEDRKKKGKRS